MGLLGQALDEVPGSPPPGWCPKCAGSCLGSGRMGWQEQPRFPPLIIRKMKKKQEPNRFYFSAPQRPPFLIPNRGNGGQPWGGRTEPGAPHWDFFACGRGAAKRAAPGSRSSRGLRRAPACPSCCPGTIPSAALTPSPAGGNRHRRPAGEKLPGTFQAVNDLISLSGRSTQGGRTEPQP